MNGQQQLIYKGIHLFQPTKEIVFGHKHHDGDTRFEKWPKVSDEEYRTTYRRLIYSRLNAIKEWYAALHEEEQLTLCCYCAQDKFCHRQLVAKTLTWLNGKMELTHTIHLF